MRILTRVLSCLCAVAIPLLSAACGKTADEYLAEGKRYIEKGQYPEAILVLRKATELNPDSGDARFHLGDAYLRAKDFEHAAIELVNASALMPKDIEAQLRAGEMMLLGRRFPEAQSVARRVLILDPKNIRGHVLNANALAGMKRHDQAMAAIERAIELDPTRADTAGDLGLLQMQGKSPEEAEKSFKHRVELDPKSVSGHITLGTLYWVTGRLDQAEAELLTAYELDPKHVAANRALATFYLGTNRSRKAEQYLLVAVEGRGTAAAELALADYYLSLGRHADAEHVLEKTAKRPDGFGEARSRMAVIKYAANKAQGHALIDETLKKDASNARALMTKAGFLLSEGKTALAFERATAAVNADPKSLPAHYMLAQIQRETGDLDGAQGRYEEILQIQPSSVAAQMELANLHIARGQPAAAIESAELAVKSRPDNLEARTILLRSLIVNGDLGRATELLDPLLKQADQRADVQWMAGILELRKQNRRAARAHFERALELRPDAIEPLDGLLALDIDDGRPAAARLRVDDALARSPRSTGVLVLAARVYGAVKDYQAAERSLKTAIEVDPQSHGAFEELSRNYALQGQLERGEREIREMAQRYPRSAGPPLVLGSFMELKRQTTDAQAWYQKALAIEPRNPIVANNLAWLYADQGGDLDEALRLALLAREQLAQRPDIADTLGWVYYKRDDVTRALPLLKQAAEQQPGNPIFHYHLGLAYAKIGDTIRARESLNRAVGRKQEFQGIANARAVLASLR